MPDEIPWNSGPPDDPATWQSAFAEWLAERRQLAAEGWQGYMAGRGCDALALTKLSASVEVLSTEGSAAGGFLFTILVEPGIAYFWGDAAVRRWEEAGRFGQHVKHLHTPFDLVRCLNVLLDLPSRRFTNVRSRSHWATPRSSGR